MFIIFIIINSTADEGPTSYNLETQNDWINCGGANWYIDPAIGNETAPSLKSGPIEDTGISRICRTVKGPGIVSFWWKTDADHQGIGSLKFFVNGEHKYTCDSRDWKRASFDLRYNGDYILMWEFIKQKSYPKGFGAGWIDDINLVPPVSDYEANPNTIYVNENENIRDAILKARDGGTIIINRGNYTGNIIIDKPLILKGSDRNNTIITAPGDIIRVYSKDVEIENLTINSGYRGIVATDCTIIGIKNINIKNCVKGLEIENSDYAVISKNIIENNEIGIELDTSNYCQINNNSIKSKTTYDHSQGILVKYSNNNTIDRNYIRDYPIGISIIKDSVYNIITRYNDFLNISICDIYFEDSRVYNTTVFGEKCKSNNNCSVKPSNLCQLCHV